MSRKVFQNNPIEKIIIDAFYPKKTRTPIGCSCFLVDLKRLELSTSRMRTERSPS